MGALVLVALGLFALRPRRGATLATAGKAGTVANMHRFGTTVNPAARGAYVNPDVLFADGSSSGFGGNALSGALGAGLNAAKSYADAKTGGAVSSAQERYQSGDRLGAAASFNAGITVAQPRK